MNYEKCYICHNDPRNRLICSRCPPGTPFDEKAVLETINELTDRYNDYIADRAELYSGTRKELFKLQDEMLTVKGSLKYREELLSEALEYIEGLRDHQAMSDDPNNEKIDEFVKKINKLVKSPTPEWCNKCKEYKSCSSCTMQIK